MGSGVSQMSLNIKEEQVEAQQDHRGELADNLTELKEGNSEYGQQKKEVSSQGIMLLEKQIEVLSKANKKVQVIKMLKKLKQHDESEMPQLKQQCLQVKKEQVEVSKQQIIEQTNLHDQVDGEKIQIIDDDKKCFRQVEVQVVQNIIQQKIDMQQPRNENIQQQRKDIIQTQQKIELNQAPSNIQTIIIQSIVKQQENTPEAKQQEKRSEIFTQFSPTLKSSTILLTNNNSHSTQLSPYYQNQKIILTSPITTQQALASFKVQSLTYCVGVGIALLEVMQKHSFNYKSYQNELSHGLYIVTSQGYSWSHHLKQEDDQLRLGFNNLKNGDTIDILYQRGRLTFSLKQFTFQLQIPSHIQKKYSLCFCSYLHQKGDSISLRS